MYTYKQTDCMSRSQQERSESTRAALVRAGRELFTVRGYADTSTPDIAARAGVTRGALYHQFTDKEALFLAVYEDVESEVTTRIAATVAAETDPVAALWRGVEAYLDACLEPAVRRVVMQEGPSVLGWARKREIDERFGLGLVRLALQGIVDAGLLDPQPLDPLAHLLLGALNEAGMLLGHAGDAPATREQLEAALRMILDALLAGKPKGRRAARANPRSARPRKRRT